MIGNTVVRSALRAECVLLRAPLAVLDQHVVSRYLDENSQVRLLFERGVGLFDSAASRLLDEPPPIPQARTRAEPPAHGRATQADASASPDEQQIEQLADELRAEQEEATLAGELADDDELRQVQTELRAKHLIEESRKPPAQQD